MGLLGQNLPHLYTIWWIISTRNSFIDITRYSCAFRNVASVLNENVVAYLALNLVAMMYLADHIQSNTYYLPFGEKIAQIDVVNLKISDLKLKKVRKKLTQAKHARQACRAGQTSDSDRSVVDSTCMATCKCGQQSTTIVDC